MQRAESREQRGEGMQRAESREQRGDLAYPVLRWDVLLLENLA
jgi:hypothetical protein